jgi:glycosyltransferase involved in cell wall biosynthesis
MRLSYQYQGFISVIIPDYNQACYLGDAIRSVLNQTYQKYEIIVVDDGSNDDSREVVAGFGDQVRYIRQENRGLGGARNTGIRAAKGDLIGLLDADDQWMPTYLEKMVSLTSQNPEAAVYYCSARGMDAEGQDLPQVFGGPVISPDPIYNTLLRANFLIPSTIMMRRSIVMSAGLFEQDLRSIHGCEDWDLWLRIALKHDFIGFPACLVRYRIHGSSLSANPAGMRQAVRTVVENHVGPEDGLPATWSKEKQRAYGGFYRYCLLSSVQHQNDWRAAVQYLYNALRADPTLATDLDLFYDLALGNQPPGYRGSPYHLDLDSNAFHIENVLKELFNSPEFSGVHHLRRLTYGTAYYAIGLAAYNIGQRSFSQPFRYKALFFRPDLWRDSRIIGNLFKSFLSPSLLGFLKKYRRLNRA